MKKALMAVFCLFAAHMSAFECITQLENDQVCIAKIIIDPYEEIGLHRDIYQQVVVAMKGGTITRLEADGSETPVEFPTGVAVFRDKDPENVFHKSVNRSSESVELIVIQLKEGAT